MLVLDFDLTKLVPAEYNPREIDEASLEDLCSSISQLGTLKPILVNSKNNVIIAGHQRTKAHIKLGKTTAPVFLLKNINIHDEVRFNQLHNATDVDFINNPVTIQLDGTELTESFIEVHPSKINGDLKSSGLAVRSEICRLLSRYGNWGNSVVSTGGEVITSPHYLLACKQLNIKARIYIISDSKLEIAKDLLTKSYGRFSYDTIKRETWLQSHAQMSRLSGVDKQFGSTLYDDIILKTLSKTDRTLDFGCGKANYVNKLKDEGYNIIGIEFYPRIQNELNRTLLNNYLIELFYSLTRYGRFDNVICDSVLNSVDTMKAQHNVLVTLNALTKPKGMVYFSGRRLEYAEQQLNRQKISTDHSYLFFPDENGFTANLRNKGWFFQKFHTDEEVIKLINQYFPNSEYKLRSRKGYSSWQVSLKKKENLPEDIVEKAISEQFNLAMPYGNLEQNEQALLSYKKALQL